LTFLHLDDLSDDDKPSASRVNGDGQPTKKMAQLRNSGESSKGIRLADIEKEADKIATPKDLKRFHESPKRVFEDTPLLHGADVLGYGEIS
jgi:hypothetical protein